MNIAVVYCYPLVTRHVYDAQARRFAQTYRSFPADYPHALYVICNGMPPDHVARNMFSGLPAQFLNHSNIGKDIGAFQMAADKIPCDLLVCLGAHVHFCRSGWLKRIATAFAENGPHLYGAWAFASPLPHIRTTAFWMAPELLRAYPETVVNTRRYEFEHGHGSFTRFVLNTGLNCLMVTWSAVYAPNQWGLYPVWGDPSDWLLRDQHCDRQGIR